jgi:hypothetical protein
MLKVGDTVVLTRSVTKKHFKSVGMSITGKITRIDPDHFVGRFRRPYFIRFDDRSGEWSYSKDEIKKVKNGT